MKQKTKRILAFAMAVVFALSTGVTSSPYTVMATEAGQTIEPLAEKGSGSGEVTPGTTETGTPGESGEGGTVAPSGEPEGPTAPSAPPAAEKKYLNVKVVLGEGAGTIGGVGLGEMQLTFSNSTSLKVGEIGAVTSTNIEYIAEQTYGVTAISSENYDVTVSGSSLQDTEANPTLVVTIGKLTPKVTGKIDGPENFCANTVAEYNLTGVWGNAVTNWELAENHADANVVKSNAGNATVEAHKGQQTFVLEAFCGTYKLASRKIIVDKNQTKLTVTTSKNTSGEPARPWKTPLDVTIILENLTDGKGIAGKTIYYTIGTKNYKGTTDKDGKITEENVQLYKYITPISVEAEFKGDDAYLGSTGNDSYPVSKQNGKLTFDKEYTKKNPLVLTYGTEDITKNVMLKDDKGKELTGEDVKVLKIDASFDSTNFVSVANTSNEEKTITFHAQNASTNPVEVTVTAETANYIFEKTIYVRVKPYELTLDTSTVSTAGTGEGRTYDNTKIYDATTNVNVKATFRGGNDLTENIVKEVENNFTDVIFENYDSKIKDVKGEEESQTFDFEPKNFDNTSLKNKTDITKNYVIKSEKNVKAEVIIQKRTLKLIVADSTRPYRSLGYTTALDQLVSVNPPSGDTGFAGKDAVDNLEGFTYPTVVDTTATGLTPENAKKNDTATCSEHTDALELDKKSGDPTSNYKFDFNSYKHGNLKVTEENITDATDYVTINNNASTHAYENEDHVRYYGKDAVIKFALEGGYNKIYLKNGTDLTTEGLKEAEAYVAGTNVEEGIYLAKEDNDGKVLNRTNEFKIDFKYDPDAPQCSEIKFGEENKVVTDLATTITFGIYKNKNIEAKVVLSDELSGIKGWSYFVANTDKDSSFEGLLTPDDYAEKLVNEHFVAGKDDCTVPVGKLKDGQTLESNNYIVFVKVMDNVGNIKIYGSNGIVLENFHDITVEYNEKPASTTTQQGTVDSRTYYSGDAELNLTAKENASESKFYSGLEKMQYTISRHWGDAKKVTEEEVTETNEYGFPKDVTLKELQKYCTIEKLLELKNDPEKSQVITVSATANDNAGNAMETRSDYTLVLDSIAPTVDSSYAQANNNGAFLNAKYANSDVTYSVNVTERFLNVLKVTLNGTEYTLEELNSQKDALGIKEISMDPVNNFADTTDSTVYKFTIVFHKDGEYTVQTKVADAAGNTGEDKEFSFVIDTVRPEMQVTYTAYRPNGTSFVLDPSRGRAYANEEVAYVAVTAVITERNFAEDNTKDTFDTNDANVAYTAVNSKGKAVEVADYDAAIREEWTNKGNVSTEDNRFVYELSLPTISVDANYDFAYDYTDLAGNPINETIKQAVTLDRAKPEGTVTVEDLVNGSASETWNKFLSAITFGHFGKNSVRASMTSDDETAGVAATQYLTSAKALTRSELEARTGWTDYSSKISLAASQNLVVYEKITDKAGNIQYISTDGIIVDNVAPVPVVKITPTNPGWGKGVYSASDNPGFDISVTDPVVNDAYAGLKTISYTITNGTTGYVESGTLANLERTSHLQSWTGHVTINPDNFYSNDVRVKVTADDWSTNDAASEEISIKVDNKAPIVTFSFDQSDVHNGKYYNNDKTLTITVDERNFDESYQPQVTSTAGGGYSVSGWSHNGEIHTATVTFSGDSDYTVTYDCFDLAGNKSNTEKLDEFTVDKTKPVIQVSYDNNSALNNNYYKEARTATITITEHNFNPGEVTVTTTAQLDGAAASAPGVSGWSGSGDTHVATVSYSADADYTFTISATDLASNVSDPYATESFTVDQTKPTVEITNIEDRSANNGEVAPVITLNDINFDSGKTVVHLTGANKGEVDTTGMYTSVASNKGQTLTFYNFKENMDDIYTLTAETTDKAGNQYSTSKIFSVNRDGSTYLYDDYTEELIKNGYTNDPKNLVVSEINVDTLTFQELTVSENGTQKTLEQNKDFEVSESGSDVSWKEYKYTINASNFENEGDYNVSIYSEDRATNVTTNTAKSKDILFAVDKTSPVISLANIEDGGRYKVESQTFTANVDDNMALDKVEYYVDDELKQTFDADEVSANGGSLELSVDSSNTFQNVSVKAYDKANNEATTASVDVLVSANTWVQFYNNKPAFYGTIGGGVAAVAAAVAAGVHFSGAAAGTAAAAGKTAAGAGIFLAGKKRKKDEE
ncbi:Ig-like domain-containing protein [Oliverpabstia intestinalis]|uniref:Ig-like domain-containing protein n=1 Tax=Oliverpabstia intestinalis TaxID=2606633 RepID=UPI003F89A294